MAIVPKFVDLQALSPIEWVRLEMQRQKSQWGEQNFDPHRYFTILAEEVGEVAQAIEESYHEKYKSQEDYRRQLEYELIQVAAVATSWLEAIRREKGSEVMPK